MKYIGRFFLFSFFVLLLMVGSFFLVEKFDALSLRAFAFEPTFQEENGQLTLSWTPLPYPAFYKVEVLSKTTGMVEETATYHFLLGKTTERATTEVPRSAIPTYYRITAYGLFGPVADPSDAIPNPDFTAEGSPITIKHYDEGNPASRMPYLIWHTVPGAVCYEVELLSEPPAVEGGSTLAKKGHLENTRQIYTNGWQADLRRYKNLSKIYYRVRALDLQLKPIGVFSKAEPIVIDDTLPFPDKPLLNTFDQMPNFEQPLYPVYDWIPTHGVMQYEIQLFNYPPEAPSPEEGKNGPIWSKIVSSATTCYDEYPRPNAGDYYWRVRAVDKKGKPLSDWSEPAHFVVKDHKNISYAALGDSITHGGGAVSFPPSSMEYSYTTYLDVPCINLGRSGDTSHTTAERFKDDVLPIHPQNLLILTGTNCLRMTGISAESVIADLENIKAQSKEARIRPIFLTLMPVNPANIRYAFHTPTDPHWHEKMQRINLWVRAQDYYIDLEPYFYDKTGHYLDTPLAIDGLHPDIRGKQLMAEIINKELKNMP